MPGDVAAIEVPVQGTFPGPFKTPAAVIQPAGARAGIPAAGLYARDGKSREFRCHIGMSTLFVQTGVLPDFASAVAASAPER